MPTSRGVQKDAGQGRTEPSAGGSAAVTPLWKGVATIVKYRTVRNHCDPEFLLQRFSDKIVFSILMATLYRGVGSDLVPSNYINIASVLYMWSVMPACAPLRFACWVCALHPTPAGPTMPCSIDADHA